MSLISTLMPEYTLRQIDRVAVRSDPRQAWEAARGVDLYELPIARWLFRLRTVLDRSPQAPHARIDDLAKAGNGFQILAEAPGSEVVIGSIGKFWQPTIDFVTAGPAAFTRFDRPGYGKLAWCIRVDARKGGGAWLTLELRVGATDPDSWARFERYWTLIGPFSHGIRHAAMRKLSRSLGRAPSEDRRPLAGDRFLTVTRMQKTHAVTIEAPPEKVWPWLMQIGAGRAGWYSYDRLDNGGVPSADRIIPELQHLGLGDVIPALPNRPGGFAVLAIEPGASLVLGDPSLAPGGTRAPNAPPWKTTWAFVLEPIGTDATRLIVRVRATYRPSVAMAFVAPVMGLAHEVMERKQLETLRTRVEHAR